MGIEQNSGGRRIPGGQQISAFVLHTKAAHLHAALCQHPFEKIGDLRFAAGDRIDRNEVLRQILHPGEVHAQGISNQLKYLSGRILSAL